MLFLEYAADAKTVMMRTDSAKTSNDPLSFFFTMTAADGARFDCFFVRDMDAPCPKTLGVFDMQQE